jgi:hypothetical protein
MLCALDSEQLAMTSVSSSRIVSTNPVGHLSLYELRHLARHLEDSGRGADLHRLLALDWAEADRSSSHQGGTCPKIVRQNAWFSIHDEMGDLSGYVTDIACASRLAEAAKT